MHAEATEGMGGYGKPREATGGHGKPWEVAGRYGKPREHLQTSQSGVPPGGTVPCSKLFLRLHVVAFVSLAVLVVLLALHD